MREQVEDSTADLLAGRRTFNVAHRLSASRRADFILLLDEDALLVAGRMTN